MNSLNPSPIIYRAYQTKDLSQLPTYLYPFNSMMQGFWSLYGHLINNRMLFGVSLFLCIVQIFYTTFSFLLRRMFSFLIMFYFVFGLFILIGFSISSNTLGLVASIIQTIAILTNLEIIVSFKNYIFFSPNSFFKLYLVQVFQG